MERLDASDDKFSHYMTVARQAAGIIGIRSALDKLNLETSYQLSYSRDKATVKLIVEYIFHLSVILVICIQYRGLKLKQKQKY